VIFERADGPFGGVNTVFVRGNSLEGNALREKGVFEILGAFVVKNMKSGSVTLMNKCGMGGEPSITNAGTFTRRDSDGVNRVRVLMIKDKEVVVAATGRDRKKTGLIGVGPEDGLFWDEHGTNLMGSGVQWRSEVEVDVGERDSRKGSSRT
jgi:hypothetical protein